MNFHLQFFLISFLGFYFQAKFAFDRLVRRLWHAVLEGGACTLVHSCFKDNQGIEYIPCFWLLTLHTSAFHNVLHVHVERVEKLDSLCPAPYESSSCLQGLHIGTSLQSSIKAELRATVTVLLCSIFNPIWSYFDCQLWNLSFMPKAYAAASERHTASMMPCLWAFLKSRKSIQDVSCM